MDEQKSADPARWHTFFQHLCPESDPTLMAVTGKFRHVSHAFYHKIGEQLGESGLSFAQYRILLYLMFTETIENRLSLNPSEISDFHGTNRNTISSLIHSLEKTGYIKRTLDAVDRRKFNICLTETGRQLIYSQSPKHAQKSEELFRTLSAEDLHELSRILDKLAKAL